MAASTCVGGRQPDPEIWVVICDLPFPQNCKYHFTCEAMTVQAWGAENDSEKLFSQLLIINDNYQCPVSIFK